MRRVATYKRDVLYAELWSEPASTVAARYSISSTALANICKKLNVPRPGRGYWVKRAHGHTPPVLPLPTKSSRSELQTVHYTRKLDRQRKASANALGRAARGKPIVVRDNADHPLVMASRRTLQQSRPRNGLVVPTTACVDVAVSTEQLERGLRIMSTVLSACEARGLSVEVVALPGARPTDPLVPATRVKVRGESIRFGLVERLRQHRPPGPTPPKNLTADELEWWLYIHAPPMKFVPTGVLALQIKHEDIGVRLSWQDTKFPIEERLGEFVQQLFVVSDAIRQVREANMAWNTGWIEEDARRREQQELDDREARELAALSSHVARWREVRELRLFLMDSMSEGVTLPASISATALKRIARLAELDTKATPRLSSDAGLEREH